MRRRQVTVERDRVMMRVDLRGLREEERATVWTLARFGEYRGVGKHTTSGMGRVRVLGTAG